MYESTEVTPDQLAALLPFMIAEREPLMIWGSPGIGKSEIVQAALAATFSRTVAFFALLHDPTVFTGFGVPNREKGVMEFLPTDFMTGDSPIGFFMDELPNAPTLVKNAGLDIVLNPDRHLPAGSYVVAAGNRPADKTGASAFPSALNRRFTHVELVPDHKAWARHEIGRGAIDPGVIAYAMFQPDCIEGKPDLSARSYANPAGMSRVGKLIKAGIPGAVEQQVLCGKIGDKHGIQLAAFLRTFRSMPSLDHILSDPANADLPASPDVTFATIHGLAVRGANDRHFPAVVEYALRLPREFGQTLVNDCTALDSALVKTAAYVRYNVTADN